MLYVGIHLVYIIIFKCHYRKEFDTSVLGQVAQVERRRSWFYGRRSQGRGYHDGSCGKRHVQLLLLCKVIKS